MCCERAVWRRIERAGVVSKGWFRKGYILDRGIDVSIGLWGWKGVRGCGVVGVGDGRVVG